TDTHIEQKLSEGYSTEGLQERVLRYAWGRWVFRRILLQDQEELFIKYEGPRDEPVPASVAHLDVERTTFMHGCVMTARRDALLKEPFAQALRYYAAAEDLDVAYRLGRHGV